MRRDYPAGAGQAVEDLANFLGTNDRLPPLLPDLLGEFLVRIVFGNDGAATSARLSRIAPVGVVQSFNPLRAGFRAVGRALARRMAWLSRTSGAKHIAIN